MTRHLDKVRIVRAAAATRLARSLARARRALVGRRPAAAAPTAGPFVFPHPRIQFRQELQRLERDQFPMWRPDYAKVRALQSQCA